MSVLVLVLVFQYILVYLAIDNAFCLAEYWTYLLNTTKYSLILYAEKCQYLPDFSLASIFQFFPKGNMYTMFLSGQFYLANHNDVC